MASTPPSSDDTLVSLHRSTSASTLGPASSNTSIYDVLPDPKRQQSAQFRRTLAFVSAVLSALCAGSITVFSLYAPRFQSRLRFSQFEINGIASAMSISLYVPVPLIGYMCDRAGPGPLALLSAALLGGGYGSAAYLYHRGEVLSKTIKAGSNQSLVPFMVLAFVLIGAGTACLYVGSITTCAKNFGKGKYRGLLLVMPMASFGLSGILASQIGSRFLYETLPDGSKGEVNVFHFFLFLAIVLTLVALFGAFALRIVDEEELIDEAVEELERSGLLEGSQIFRRARLSRSYGAIDDARDIDDAGILGSDEDCGDVNSNWLKKNSLLNAETQRFLSDHTMWWFALGFWLIIGPGESFLNNLGTVIGTLYSPGPVGDVTSAATHVSIVAATSTVSRLLVGSLSDLLSPAPQSQHPQGGPESVLLTSSRKYSISRVTMMIVSSLILSVGTGFLASGAAQGHGERFWVVSGFIGSGYGAIFSLMPIVVTIIWGVENFGTNFGIVAVFPAVGSTMWGLIYSAVYQSGARNSPAAADGADDDMFCYGKQCYSSAYWAMTGSIWIGCLMILWAWRGRGGWASQGIVI
ncbi:major facilitator superfamily domain-containing protein [Xylariales sp. PMI_506]|nr:major facilitator superfamily domain-containing protein [Xylariales sp. PMI_506]